MAKNKQKPRLRNRVAGAAIDTVVPRAKNGFQPYLINRYGMAIVIMLVLGLGIVHVQQNPAVLGSQANIRAPELLEQVNTERSSAALPALKLNPKLMAAAQAKADDMIKSQYWAHESPSGAKPWKWVNEAGYKYAYAGENLAKNFSTAGSTVAAWMASEGHKRNLLHEYYTEAGFAIVDGELENENVTLVVGLFATPATSLTSVAGATTTPGDATTLAPQSSGINPLERFGIILQSSDSAAIGAIAVALVALVVALTVYIASHWHSLSRGQSRSKTKKNRERSFRIKTAGKIVVLAALIVGIAGLIGGGQI